MGAKLFAVQDDEGLSRRLTSAALSAPISQTAATPISAFVFDVAGVLYDATPWWRWLWRLVQHMGLGADYAAFCRAWQEGFRGDVHCGRREYGEALQSFLLGVGLSWAQIDEVEAASGIQRHHLELGVRALPGVVRTVGRLAQCGRPLVAWTDGPHPAARSAELLDRLGLAGRFHTVLSSFDLECTQPAPDCYRAILDRVQSPAAEVVYVGHDAAHLAGARAAGLRTVAFNFEPLAQADYYLARFEDLLLLVNAWQLRPAVHHVSRAA